MSSMSRRQFLKVTGTSLVGSSLALMGFAPGVALAEVRQFKLARATETRNTCTYCSVACGILIYSMGDRAKNARSNIIHIEGDPDHPVNRGTLCPKGSALLDVVHAPTRLKTPRYRPPGATEFKEVSWDFALDRIGSPALRTMLDVSAASQAETDPVHEVLARHLASGHIAHIQLNDRNRRGPGQGDTALLPVLRTLRHAGYAGWMAVEPFDYVPDGPGSAAFSAGHVTGLLCALEQDFA